MGSRAPLLLPFVLLACDAFGGHADGSSPPETTPVVADAGAATPAADGGPPGASGFDAPVDVASTEQTPGPIVVDDDAVYWLDLADAGNTGALVKLTKADGVRTVLASNLPSPVGLASDATRLFVSANDNNGGSFQFIIRQSKSGGTPVKVLLTSNDEVDGITVQGGLVYWSLASQRIVGYLDTQDPFSSSSLGNVAQSVGPVRVLAADATHVYAGGSGKITKIDKVTHAAVPFATSAGTVNAIVLDDDAVYWTESSTVRRLAKGAPGDPPLDLASGQDGATALALDTSSAYWTTVGDGAVRSVAKTGGGTTTIARGEAAPTGLAVDATGVWWTNRASGRIRHVRRAP